MGKSLTQPSEPPPSGKFDSEEPGSMNSRPTPAVPLRVWSEDDVEDEPTSVIHADRLAAACEALKTSDTVDFAALGLDKEVVRRTDVEQAAKVDDQKFWDGRPSHLELSKLAAEKAKASATASSRRRAAVRYAALTLLFTTIAVLAYKTTMTFAPRSQTVQSLLNALYK